MDSRARVARDDRQRQGWGKVEKHVSRYQVVKILGVRKMCQPSLILNQRVCGKRYRGGCVGDDGLLHVSGVGSI